jgi:hypothetical protein
MYTDRNFKSKKELKQALADGKQVMYYQPGPFGENVPTDGVVYLEGPHYPEPHTWYATARVADGLVVSVK